MQQGSALVVEAEMARREAEAVVERMGAVKDETEIDVSTCHVIDGRLYRVAEQVRPPSPASKFLLIVSPLKGPPGVQFHRIRRAYTTYCVKSLVS